VSTRTHFVLAFFLGGSVAAGKCQLLNNALTGQMDSKEKMDEQRRYAILLTATILSAPKFRAAATAQMCVLALRIP
jgi:hypothetical protein